MDTLTGKNETGGNPWHYRISRTVFGNLYESAMRRSVEADTRLLRNQVAYSLRIWESLVKRRELIKSKAASTWIVGRGERLRIESARSSWDVRSTWRQRHGLYIWWSWIERIRGVRTTARLGEACARESESVKILELRLTEQSKESDRSAKAHKVAMEEMRLECESMYRRHAGDLHVAQVDAESRLKAY